LQFAFIFREEQLLQRILFLLHPSSVIVYWRNITQRWANANAISFWSKVFAFWIWSCSSNGVLTKYCPMVRCLQGFTREKAIFYFEMQRSVSALSVEKTLGGIPHFAWKMIVLLTCFQDCSLFLVTKVVLNQVLASVNVARFCLKRSLPIQVHFRKILMFRNYVIAFCVVRETKDDHGCVLLLCTIWAFLVRAPKIIFTISQSRASESSSKAPKIFRRQT